MHWVLFIKNNLIKFSWKVDGANQRFVKPGFSLDKQFFWHFIYAIQNV